MKLGRFVAMGAAGALVLSLSACNSPSTAAVVDGQRISTSEVTEATDGFNRATERVAAKQGRRATAAPEAAVLNLMMRAKAAESLAGPDAAALRGHADLLLNDPDWANPEYVNDPAARPFVRAIAIAETQAQAMGEEQFEAALQRVKTQVNPRYGLADMKALSRDATTGEPLTRSSSLSNAS
ncbi:hypothetical protein GCM10027418_02700 [Mariniluteicoccus endophyticus]